MNGGRDPGAVGFIREVDIVYPWADYFVQALRRLEFDAILTHGRPTKHRKVSLRKRYRAANRMNADLFISIHADAWKTETPEGACAFVYKSGSQAHRIAHSILPALQEGIGSHGNVRFANYKVLRKTNMPAILLEIGFVTNPEDSLWLMKHYKEQVRRVAVALANAPLKGE